MNEYISIPVSHFIMSSALLQVTLPENLYISSISVISSNSSSIVESVEAMDDDFNWINILQNSDLSRPSAIFTKEVRCLCLSKLVIFVFTYTVLVKLSFISFF